MENYRKKNKIYIWFINFSFLSFTLPALACIYSNMYLCIYSIYLPEWQDSRQDDRQHYAMAVCVPHNWRKQIQVVTHKWSPCRHRPTHSLPLNWTQPAMCHGIRSMLWKNSALLLHLWMSNRYGIRLHQHHDHHCQNIIYIIICI